MTVRPAPAEASWARLVAAWNEADVAERMRFLCAVGERRNPALDPMPEDAGEAQWRAIVDQLVRTEGRQA